MLTLAKAGLFMLPDRWNGSTAKLMTDPRLLVVNKELKPLMDMYHFLLNLVGCTCTPSESLLIRTFNNIPPDTCDASVLDHGITPSLLEEINQENDDSLLQDSIFDEYGDRAVQKGNIFWHPHPTVEHTFHTQLNESNHAEEDWKSLRPYFGWKSEQVIQDTYKVTSRFGGTIPHSDYLKKHFKSRNPVFNTPRRNQPVATDTIFSDTPAINDGSTMAQFFVRKDTLESKARKIYQHSL